MSIRTALSRTAAAGVVTASLVAGAVVVGGSAAQAFPLPPGRPGATTSGDPYFPNAGNGGYDVRNYDLSLAYSLDGRLDGTAVITLAATQTLASFSLDLRGLTATSVLVDGRPAAFTQVPPPASGRGGELVVTPDRRLFNVTVHRVTVVYGGVPGQPLDIEGASYGWTSFPDGAFVANEPEGAATWYPVNDVLTDKATYDFRITVPTGKTAIANGVPVGDPVTRGASTTFTWRARDPMASYLSTASIGDYVLTRQTGPRGLPIYDYVETGLDPADAATTRAALDLEPQMLTFFAGIYGPYPFSSFGSIVDDDSVGYALETQTRPIYSGVADESTVAHELAHQWVGDSVTPSTWQDIWLNEGFATYSEWRWDASRGGPSLQERFDSVYATPAEDDFWATPPGDPGPETLFAAATYDRGGAALQALSVEIGPQAFDRLLRRWTTENRGRSVSTADLVALAERVSGQQLDDFFRVWIDEPTKPTTW